MQIGISGMRTASTLIVHPHPGSWPAEPPAFAPLRLPQRLLVPLHKEAEQINIGRRVERGERLAPPAGEHAAVLAPAAGHIIGIGRASLTSGTRAPAVEIETADIAPTTPDQGSSISGLSSSADVGAWIDRLRHAGISADRRTSPSLIGQLTAALRRPVDMVLCSLLDSEVAARHNSFVAAARPEELAAGVLLLSQMTGARSSRFVAEAGSPGRWWAPIRKSVQQSAVRFVFLNNDYPQADPTLLLHTLLNRRLRPRRLPVELGVLLLDAAAAADVGRCALGREPNFQAPVAVHDSATGRGHFLMVTIGTKVADVLDELEIDSAGSELRAGAMLRDVPITPEHIIASEELVLHVTPSRPPTNPEPCIRCGWCVDACPTRIHPAGLLEASQREDAGLADHYGIEACIECGICSYACPSHLPLLDGIRKVRRMILT